MTNEQKKLKPFKLRATCPECGKDVALRTNGQFARHGLGWKYGGGCNGSFRKWVDPNADRSA